MKNITPWMCLSFLSLFILSNCQSFHSALPEKVTIAHRTNPTRGDSESLGGTSLGCLKGGKTFHGKENGIVISQSRRGRFWGHSLLIDLLTELGEFTYQRHKRYLVLGDLSLSRGGPTFGGHSSHQNGLDVDIWFETLAKRPKWDWLQTQEMKSIITPKGLERTFGDTQLSMMTYLSQDDRVARIFVHPDIKKYLCEKKRDQFQTEGLRKIRPWYGHDDHLHLRLKCSSKDKECIDQAEPPAGDGCDQLSWWYSDEAKKEMESKVYTYKSQRDDYIQKSSSLPKACQNIYQDQLL